MLVQPGQGHIRLVNSVLFGLTRWFTPYRAADEAGYPCSPPYHIVSSRGRRRGAFRLFPKVGGITYNSVFMEHPAVCTGLLAFHRY